MRNGLIKYGAQKMIGKLMEVTNDWMNSNASTHKLKFALYIVFLIAIFTVLWRKMVANMKMDIINALGILNILPTSHLATNPQFIKEINTSSLIN